MKNILSILFVTLNLFCGSTISTKKDHDENKKHYPSQNISTNNFPINDHQWHVGLEGSYLYWMMGSHCTYANVFQSSRALTLANGARPPMRYIEEELVDIISGKALAKSGFSARISFLNQNITGYEFGVKYQWIQHKDDVLENCTKIFTDNEWLALAADPNVQNFPIPNENNGLIAKLNISLPNSFGIGAGDFSAETVAFRLDKIDESLRYESVVLDITNYSCLRNSKFFNFGFSTGLEIDWFKNNIQVRGGVTDLAFDINIPQIYLDSFHSAFFAYKLENDAFSIGPFVSLNGALRLERPKHIFQLKGSLYGAGLYTKNRYKQDTALTDYFVFTLDDWAAQNPGVAPASIYPQSSCDVQFTNPQLCYNPTVTLYHAKVTLGLYYEFVCKNMEVHTGIDWETNSFLNFFDRDFYVYSHDDLNYQGLTATIGFAF